MYVKKEQSGGGGGAIEGEGERWGRGGRGGGCAGGREALD